MSNVISKPTPRRRSEVPPPVQTPSTWVTKEGNIFIALEYQYQTEHAAMLNLPLNVVVYSLFDEVVFLMPYSVFSQGIESGTYDRYSNYALKHGMVQKGPGRRVDVEAKVPTPSTWIDHRGMPYVVLTYVHKTVQDVMEGKPNSIQLYSLVSEKKPIESLDTFKGRITQNLITRYEKSN